MKRIVSLIAVCCLFSALLSISFAFSEEIAESALEAPAGMIADSIGGFVYFIWDDWVMIEENKEAGADVQARTYARSVEDENSASCFVTFIETANRTDGMTPNDIIQGLFLGLAMSAADEEGQRLSMGFEPLQIREMNGYLFTLDNQVMLMGAAGTAVISIGFHDPELSVTEARDMLFKILGASASEPKQMESENPALYGTWALVSILDVSGQPLDDFGDVLDSLTGNTVWQFFADGTCTIRFMEGDTFWYGITGTYSMDGDATLITDFMGTEETYSYTIDGDNLHLVRNGYTQVYSRKVDE